MAYMGGVKAAALNGWLNGKRTIPVTILCEIWETVGAEPCDVIQRAYDRMAVELGEASGDTY